MNWTCQKKIASEAFWNGCRTTLELIRDKWKAEHQAFASTKVSSPPNPHTNVFPVLSREYLEGVDYGLLEYIDCNCNECK
jgi:hypothetical protein